LQRKLPFRAQLSPETARNPSQKQHAKPRTSARKSSPKNRVAKNHSKKISSASAADLRHAALQGADALGQTALVLACAGVLDTRRGG